MLSQENRLRRDQDFKRVFSKGRGVFDSACGVKTQANGRDVSRFAVVVGTKVSKSAVKRNRIRRQYQEILRLHLAQLAPGFDVILLCGKDALTFTYEEKEKRLMQVLKRAKLVL